MVHLVRVCDQLILNQIRSTRESGFADEFVSARDVTAEAIIAIDLQTMLRANNI